MSPDYFKKQQKLCNFSQMWLAISVVALIVPFTSTDNTTRKNDLLHNKELVASLKIPVAENETSSKNMNLNKFEDVELDDNESNKMFLEHLKKLLGSQQNACINLFEKSQEEFKKDTKMLKFNDNPKSVPNRQENKNRDMFQNERALKAVTLSYPEYRSTDTYRLSGRNAEAAYFTRNYGFFNSEHPEDEMRQFIYYINNEKNSKFVENMTVLKLIMMRNENSILINK